jgi:diaminohydroxyphosphoribosylaminopyrimidine deaminase/5-amino-6-(5-phosphoribosylamino)uracil reductase
LVFFGKSYKIQGLAGQMQEDTTSSPGTGREDKPGEQAAASGPGPEEAPPFRFMRRALEVSLLARGRSSPNPAVGAVVTDAAGNPVGEGCTQPPGQAHAEVMALRLAGEKARGGTLYVTLEPCSAYGRTPPCTKAIIEAGIGRVYYAVQDPNPRMHRGAQVLREAGIEVIEGPLTQEAAVSHEAFFHWLRTGKPFVVAKYAMTLDGKIATRSGHSRWITGPRSREAVHRLRDESDAIMVGINTVLLDDPALTTRLETGAGRPGCDPLRVIVDSKGRLPLTARVTGPGTLLATTRNMAGASRQELEAKGVEVLVLPAGGQGRVDLDALLEALGQRGILQLMVEGGGSLLASLVFNPTGPRINKVWAFIAPKLVGGSAAPGPVGGPGVERMDSALTLERVKYNSFDSDLLIEGYFHQPVNGQAALSES